MFDPLEYSDLVPVMNQSTLVVTDSGGLQEEAPSLGKPVLVLRHVTERPEAIKAGTVQVVGTNEKKIVRAVSRLLTDKSFFKRMANAVNLYGDGAAARRTKEAIQWYFGLKKS
jgi:UDP-N-acetylglucosamine 2-epimerase (non-hydrolysing)